MEPRANSFGGTAKPRYFILPFLLGFIGVATWHNQQMLSTTHLNGSACATAGDLIEPIRFISVAGLYHTGTTNLWNSINLNIENGVASSRGVELGAYPGGIPPCGVSLLSDFSVDMDAGDSSGITEQNAILYGKWGTMWADWFMHSPKGMSKMGRGPPQIGLRGVNAKPPPQSQRQRRKAR
eukprot:g10001.t1 g10001   contig4:1031707-1032347(+)